MSHWAYEGSEKKLELTFNIGNGESKIESLRDLSRGFWASLVDAAGAKIISELSSHHVDAYLLSESSLFVFKDRILMITCGRTQLINAAKVAIEKIGVEHLNAIYFDRKNEVFPQAQLSSFDQDATLLKEWFPDGQIQHIEYSAVGGFIHLFHWCKTAPAVEQARTFELLMHDLDPSIIASLRDHSTLNQSKWSRTLHFQNIFPNFLVNERWFEPNGYSLNAVLGSEYFTIHITPEEDTSYVSVETNHAFASDIELKKAIQTILNVFKPRTSLLVQFHHESHELMDCSFQRPEFQLMEKQVLDLPPGVKYSFNAIRRVDSTPEEIQAKPFQLAKAKNSVWINQQ
jgi:S-adenosylmethionine decarboxylase